MANRKKKLAANQYELDIGATWTYSVDWSKQLTEAGTSISTSSWILDAGLEEVESVIDGDLAKIKVRASLTAKRGVFYRAQNTIETVDVPPLEDSQSIFIEFIDQ